MAHESEKRIIAKMNSIKNGTLTPADSKIGILFRILKEKDEPAYDKLFAEYKQILKSRTNV